MDMKRKTENEPETTLYRNCVIVEGNPPHVWWQPPIIIRLNWLATSWPFRNELGPDEELRTRPVQAVGDRRVNKISKTLGHWHRS